MKPLPACAAAILALLFLPCCSRSSAPAEKAGDELQGRPDIVAEAAKPGSPWLAFKLQNFQINQIWGADGSSGNASAEDKEVGYRAKVTLWDENQDAPVAEIFFRDQKPSDANIPQQNPEPDKPNDPNDQSVQDPHQRGRTYRLHFPSNTMDGILNTLRFSNTDVYLFYYEKQWAIGTGPAEKIGSN